MSTDLLLSSGYISFGRQTGFLRAVEEAGLDVGAVQGTSSGALCGAMWCAGHDAAAILAELTAQAPLFSLRPRVRFWRGAFGLDGMIRSLRDSLPATFEELDRPFAVGVMTPEGEHRLIRSGPLPEAVAASCAIPRLFRPVVIDGQPYQDGGFVKRVGLEAWRDWRPGQRAFIHRVAQSNTQAVPESLGDWPVVETPRSGARLWSFGDVERRYEEARELTHARLALGL